MAKNDNLKDFVTDIADAIREKKGTTDLINPQDFSDEIRNLTTESDLIEAPILPPAELVNNGKIYRVHSGAEYFFSSIEDNPDYVLPLDDVIISFNENFGTGITNVEVIVVESVENIENPRATAAPNLYIYADSETYEGFAFIDQDGTGQLVKTSLVEVLDELSGGLFWGVEYIGAVDNKSDITQNGVYYVKEEKTIIGVPNADGEKDISVFDGTEWTSAGASNGLDYDQVSGIWYASSLDGNGRVESIMYYVFPLLQDGNGKRNVKVYSADAEGFYDSTTPGMTYRIDGNQIKLEMESEGEINDAGSFDYEVVDNKVHLTMDGEVFLTKIVTGLGKNDNGQLVCPTITGNGVYNAVALNDPESLFFGAVIDVEGSSGGEETIGDYHIKVIDSYNNNVIDEKWLNTGDIYTLPSPTTHDDVIFDSWECAVPINDGTIVVTNHDIIISNTYLTKSNKSEFKIKITKEIIQNIENGGYLFTLNLDGVKDWGDGTINSETSHTYTQYGEYVISCDGQTMTTTNASGIFGQSSSSKNYTCIDVKITNITRITDYAFQYCCVLQRVLLPQGIQYINDYAFAYCYRLKNIVVPKSALTLSASALYNCSSLEWCVLAYGLTTISGAFNGCTFLEYIEFPDTCKTLYSNIFSNCYRLIKIKLPNQISNVGTNCFSACSALNGVLEFKHDTKISEISSYAFSGCKNIEKIIFNTPKIEYIRAYAFRYCYNLKEIEFSNIESVPSLASTNAFTGTEQKDYKIIVPDALYDTWKSSTNWSSLANNIYKKSEV